MSTELAEQFAGLGDGGLTDRFRALELHRRLIESEMAAIVAEGERRAIHTIDGHRTMKHWIRAQTNCPVTDAGRLRRLSKACTELPAVTDALSAGHIGVAQADELARLHANPRCGDQLADVAALLLEHAEQLSFEDFRVVTRRWETLADLDGAERNDEMSHDRRTATVGETQGHADITASGGTGAVAAELMAIFQHFVEAEFDADVAARTESFGPDAPASALSRTDAQRRFDALVTIFRTAVKTPADAVAPEPVVNLLVGLNTYERLLAQRGMGTWPTDPDPVDLNIERMESVGGIGVAANDVIAATLTGVVRRVVIDSAGVVVNAGRKRRLFTGTARDMALLLWQHCTHTGCTVAADRCDVDHLQEWDADHGLTDQHNAGPRCSTHNPWKSKHQIRTTRDPDGYLTDWRPDGTPIAPIGRRVKPSDQPDTDEPVTDDRAATIGAGSIPVVWFEISYQELCVPIHRENLLAEMRHAITPA